MDKVLKDYKGKTELKALKRRGREQGLTSQKVVGIRNYGERKKFQTNDHK